MPGTSTETNGNNYITMEVLKPMLEQLKSEIVQEVSGKITADVAAAFTRQIETEVRPLYDDWEKTQKRLATHSNTINEHTQQLIEHVAHDKRVMELFEQTDKRFDDSNQRYDKIGDDLKSVVSSLSQTEKMIDFVHRNVGENRADIVRNENRFDDYIREIEQTSRSQQERYEELKDMVSGALKTQNDIATIKQQLAEQAPVVDTLLKMRGFLKKRGGKIAAIAITVAVPNAAAIIEFLSKIHL